MELLAELAHLFLQIGRITLFIIAGLFLANIIESLHWGERLAVIARPIIRLGRLSSFTGASFSIAFFSGVSANTMLADAYEKKQIEKKELVLANLFNSLPRFFLHLPTVMFLTAPFLHGGAIIYVSLTFSAALLQSLAVICAGRMLLTPQPFTPLAESKRKKTTLRQAIEISIARSKKKILRVLKYMVPIYLLFFIAGKFGFFTGLNDFLAHHTPFLQWLRPEALGIVVLHITAEFSAGLAAASVLLMSNSLTIKEVVLALMVGNILAAPIRAIRHQLPYYSGIYSPKLAVEMIVVSQGARVFSIMVIATLYYFCG